MSVDDFALFPTPVSVFEIPQTALAARHLIPPLLEESRRQAGIAASNEGGTWHSAPDLARRGDPGWDALARLILLRVREVFDALARASGTETAGRELRYGIQMWATVTPPGGYVVVHDHGESHWSTALYLDSGDADPEVHPQSGVLGFLDPRRVPPSIAGVNVHPSVFSVRPRTGALVVFPGWLQHFVHPYRGSRPRVCVSANVRMDVG